MSRSGAEALVERLMTGPVERGQLAEAGAHLRQWSLGDRKLVERLCRAALLPGPAARRHELLHTLGHVPVPPRFRARIGRALAGVLADRRAPGPVRAEAAEGLGHRYLGAGQVPPEIAGVALGALADPEPEVQFWCAYALGSFRWQPARSALAELAATTPSPVVEGWWSVAAEAADSITRINGGSPPERVPGAAGDGLG